MRSIERVCVCCVRAWADDVNHVRAYPYPSQTAASLACHLNITTIASFYTVLLVFFSQKNLTSISLCLSHFAHKVKFANGSNFCLFKTAARSVNKTANKRDAENFSQSAQNF